jgi:hypothetical protein
MIKSYTKATYWGWLMKKRKILLGLTAILVITTLLIAGCGTPPQNQQPIEVTSFGFEDTSIGCAPIPAGPRLRITLKNVSTEPVVSLDVTLEEKQGSKTWSRPLSFNITPSNPLLPNKSSSVGLLGPGGPVDGISCSLTINGTLQSGATFTYIWEPSSK